MKNVVNLGAYLVLVFLLLNCGSHGTNAQKSQSPHPFKVLEATYNNWAGGQPGVSGFHVSILLDTPDIELDTLYFRNRKTLLKKIVNSSKNKWVATFVNSPKKDRIIAADPLSEYGNLVPDLSLKIPFQLRKNEAVIQYLYRGENRYLKVSDMKKIKELQRL